MPEDKKTIKVRLHHIEYGVYLEVWKVQTEEGSPKRYVGRDMSCCDRLWSALCDAPYGCCEPDCHLSKAVEIIVCDKNWNEHLIDGNDRELYPESFPTLEETHDSEWAAVKKQIPGVTKEGFSTWIEAKMPPNVSDIDRLNWQAPTHYDVIETKVLRRFAWLGENYVVLRQTNRHTMCDAIWYGYFTSKEKLEQYESLTFFYGYEYGDQLTNSLKEKLTKK